jgi:hypothetical protein
MDKEIVVYLTSLCVNWAFLGTSVLKWPTRTNLHTLKYFFHNFFDSLGY